MSETGQHPTHPVQYEAVFEPQRSRVTTFFRIILVIPHLVVLLLWGLAAYVTTFIAWFAIVITGSYPKGLWGSPRSTSCTPDASTGTAAS